MKTSSLSTITVAIALVIAACATATAQDAPQSEEPTPEQLADAKKAFEDFGRRV